MLGVSGTVGLQLWGSLARPSLDLPSGWATLTAAGTVLGLRGP